MGPSVEEQQMAMARASAASSGLGTSRQIQQDPDHILDLLLVRVAIAHRRLFDLHGGIFKQRQARLLRRQHQHAPAWPTAMAVVTLL